MMKPSRPVRKRGAFRWLLVPLFCLVSLDTGASEPAGLWKKHIVLSAAETGGGVNTVLANDFDGDGKLDIISSF
ncbi:MAG: hypothetical protein VX387_10540, partial [Planctomycetota bacterium]|nr:hypothetical protein [Planctomycetota bacterium]